MRQAYRIIPIYTADVSGVCSALYELGGMTVMHDPSGCNSTYNTHDEIRWYDQDSLIFISGLTDIDAIMGNDEKFLRDIEDVAEELKPKFIALASSPIPFMNGTDFPGLARALTAETGIPAFSVPTSGMHDYVYGAGLALSEIARHFTGAAEKRKRKLNLLGVTPLDFGPQPMVDAMKRRLEKYGWEILSTWAMGDTLEDLSHAGEAEVNLVVSSVGIPAANVLREKFGTPFLVGTPVEGYEGEISDALEKAAESPCEAFEDKKENSAEKSGAQISGEQEELWKVTPDQVIYLRKKDSPLSGFIPTPDITLIGEPVTMGSLAAAIEQKCGKKVQLLCPLEITEGLLRQEDEVIRGEEAMEEKLKTARIIVADPLYRPICPESATFYEMPHIAFSGRIYLKNLYNFRKTT
ncbi:nitrogenase component 1 [Blautia sp. NSJ-166]|uniref:nitrogenase component 1 n=1 Tax=Blautia sp. NSJ-166 TaxID=2931882 RepID=UPI001FD3E561|nr:nitrogenase component 1 [Blautia sp. NSJ-166]MCJ8044708.1 nitrogenase component 1 [Blautia sp. NSJ-166]